ncbi:hypothetical protein [Candidatus Bodocaedibacter vickermanii]|uniref:Uncharacterized protein n=1 Tax=Candidatus Bodocaedibacter vickermanii TaxID=2741701 RepID=A0A7L9RT34_9PROT|nr:hypothetical protein CPBP_00545 [Candidatus Paracaedibacteraceae bacterium 'Lake Konstanz']
MFGKINILSITIPLLLLQVFKGKNTMFKKVLATLALLSSVLFGSLTDIPDIQDPEFSCKGLKLEEVPSESEINAAIKAHVESLNIKHRSYTANKDFLIGSPEQLVDTNGHIKDEALKSFNDLILALYFEAFVLNLIFNPDEIDKYTTPESSTVFKQLFWNRVHLIRAAFTEMIKITEVSISHSQQTDYTIIKDCLENKLTQLNAYVSRFKDESVAFGLSLAFYERHRDANDELLANLEVLLHKEPMSEDLAAGEPYALNYIRRVNALLEKGSQ